MSLVDTLRNARSGPTTILHEFRTNYLADQPRVHAFVEGDEDLVFYRRHLHDFFSGDWKVYLYRCGNKQRVYDTFLALAGENPQPRNVFFFVDKDLADILGETWPEDPRIFVTHFYSIENYITVESALKSIWHDFITLRNVAFDPEVLEASFISAQQQFYKSIAPVMAWIIEARFLGARPNLNNINCGFLCSLSDELGVTSSRNRLQYLTRVTGTEANLVHPNTLRARTSSLLSRHAKCWIRGKFESWFFVEFLKRMTAVTGRLAEEVGGSVAVRANLERSNLISLASGRIRMPIELERFLLSHFPEQQFLYETKSST